MGEFQPWQWAIGIIVTIGIFYTGWVQTEVRGERQARSNGDKEIWHKVNELENEATTLERRLSDKMDTLATKADLSAMEARMTAANSIFLKFIGKGGAAD